MQTLHYWINADSPALLFAFFVFFKHYFLCLPHLLLAEDQSQATNYLQFVSLIFVFFCLKQSEKKNILKDI